MDKIILSKEQIDSICQRLANEIKAAIKAEDKIPVIIGVMRGALPFMHDLVKYIDAPIYLDYLQISSYSGTKSTGTVQLVKDVSFDLTGRTAIIVEDIVDTGLSMKYLINHIKNKKAKDVKVCALFDKKANRKIEVECDFIGSKLTQDYFLVGYGLDYNELLRNENQVRVLSPEEKYEIDNLLGKKG